MHAHHIIPFWLVLKRNNIKTLNDTLSCDELWDTNNGQLLCVKCHREV